MNWEIGIDMYTLMCIKWMTNKDKNKQTHRKGEQIYGYQGQGVGGGKIG